MIRNVCKMERTRIKTIMSNSLYNEKPLEWIAEAEQSGERVDKFVTDSIDDAAVSRTQVQEWIKAGAVQVDGKIAKANVKVLEGNTVVLHIPEPEEAAIVPENIPLEVIYEDSDLIVINKKRGMVVHPAPGHSSGTLVNALMYHCKDLSG